ncbi:MAG: hypothetical protein OER86_01170, partial [Phycisphaerae bacterium]|nr:hypothetical protein [Phycisphaerae bacterium]
ELQTWVPLTSFGRFKWHDKLEEDLTRLDVLLDSRALNDMLVAAFEAYLSPRPKRRKGYEVYGIGLGGVRTVQAKTQRKGITLKHYVSVSRVQLQLSAEGAMGWVEPNDRSMLALLKASTTLFPHYQVVGDFHSHPYDQWSDLVYHEGWTYSSADQKANYQAAKSMIDQGHRMMMAFIVAVARSGRKVRPSRFRGLPNTIQLSVGECRTVVAAYRSLESGRYSTRHLRLRLPGMLE